MKEFNLTRKEVEDIVRLHLAEGGQVDKKFSFPEGADNGEMTFDWQRNKIFLKVEVKRD